MATPTYTEGVPNPLMILGFAATTASETAKADPQTLGRLRLLLWSGAAALVLLFGIVLLFTVLRIVRRRYFAKEQNRAEAAATPWQAAGQRVQPVEGGELIDGETPDDDPERYERERQARMDRDPNEDTGPLPGDDDEGWRDDDEDEEERW